MTTIEELTKKIVDFRNKRGWNKQHQPKNVAISLMLEAAEFLEIFQWTSDNKIPKGKRKLLEEELIDVLYWVFLIAHDFKMDLNKAFLRKMKKNEQKYPVNE